MQASHKQWALEIINKKLNRWSGQNVPASIELDATRFLFSQIALTFCKKKDIAIRIRASKAQTVTELKSIIESAKPT